MQLNFASSEPAVRDSHWVLDASFIIVAALLLIALYLIARAILTKSQNLPVAPGHVREASAILKWIAFASPSLMLLGACFENYDRIIEMGIRGELDLVFLIILISNLLVFLGIGVFISLVTLVGIAAIFLKRLRHERRA